MEKFYRRVIYGHYFIFMQIERFYANATFPNRPETKETGRFVEPFLEERTLIEGFYEHRGSKANIKGAL